LLTDPFVSLHAPDPRVEQLGLDLSEHGEESYRTGEVASLFPETVPSIFEATFEPTIE
jgi:hypothetical protein